MKVSVKWLKDYVEIKTTPEKLAEVLTMSGIHVESLKNTGGDHIIEFEITSNRSDCLSFIGIAREIAAITGGRLTLPKGTDKKNTKGNNSSKKEDLTITIQDKKECLRYTGRIIRNLRVGASPAWLKEKLESIDLRSVNNIVDITNFLLMETGQPMHAFDLDKIKGDVIVRKAEKGEKLILIDGSDKTLDKEMLIIADDSGPIAIAGVMGGINTEVTGTTKNILLESAYFDPVSVRTTARKLGISSEASYRFERKVNQSMILPTSNRAAIMIRDIAGGTAKGLIDKGLRTDKRKPIPFDPAASNKILGVDIPTAKQKDILKKLNFTLRPKGKNLEIIAPESRKDISQAVDITEEIIRVYGYNLIPETIPAQIGNTATMDGDIRAREIIRANLVLQGLKEIKTYSTISKELHREFIQEENLLAAIKNPLSREQEVLTQTLLPGLLRVVSHNLNRKNTNLSLFEIAKTYKRMKRGAIKELTGVSLAVTGLVDKSWAGKSRGIGFYDIKGMIVSMLSSINIKDIVFETNDEKDSFEHAADIKVDGNIIGIAGRVSSETLKKFEIKEKSVFIAELCIEELLKKAKPEKRFREIPKFPAIFRDISIVADDQLQSQDIINSIKKTSSNKLKNIRLLNLYKGTPIEKGKKNLLYRLEYRDNARTLTDNEVEEENNRIKDVLTKELSISFR